MDLKNSNKIMKDKGGFIFEIFVSTKLSKKS
jgi:hypothetical protein